ncbi:MAG: preprotein translocase subunit SecG [Candidatus Kapaibacterium sp.]
MLVVAIIILIILSILLIGVVLLQPGKGDMLSGLGGISSQMSTMWGTHRTSNILTRTTIGLAGAILGLSLLTNIFFVGANDAVERPAVEELELPMQQTPIPGQGIPGQPAPQQQQQQQQQQQPQQQQQQQQQDDGNQQPPAGN